MLPQGVSTLRGCRFRRRGGNLPGMQRIFVGDVQGCADELEALLARAERRFGDRFELWLVGDLVNRGPASLGVLRTVRALHEAGRARLVLGNHDLALVRAGLGVEPLAPGATSAEVLEQADADDLVDWLRRQPVLVTDRLGDTPFVMVHAAVPPDAGLEALAAAAKRIGARLGGAREEARALLAADPAGDPDRDLMLRLLHCRPVRSDGSWSGDAPERPGDAWYRRLAGCAPGFGVVYGHWSRRGLVVEPGLRGLDTGCVHHGRGGDGVLTAWLPDPEAADPFAVPDDAFWREPARRRYHPWRRA